MKVHVFNDKGALIGPVESPKVEKTEDQWREQLTDEQYRIARQAGTERAGTGALLKNKAQGVYTCVACGLPLFDSSTKFESGTGWPSFYEPIADTNIAERRDTSHGMVRVEVLCPRCESHLGHVFNDGPRPTGLRYCLNSASLDFVDKADVATLAEPAAPSDNQSATNGADNTAALDEDLAAAVFAGGCFWCTEAVFEPLEGVVSVESGYAGGTAQTANYQAVSTGTTDHAEVIRVAYDPSRISYEKLLEVFFTVAHDPTQLNRQGPDRGRQYRSAVFYADESQRQAAERYIRQLEASDRFSDPIVTTLEPLRGYYPAESYHQDFVQKNPTHGYIVQQALPKVRKLYDKFGDAVKQPAEN